LQKRVSLNHLIAARISATKSRLAMKRMLFILLAALPLSLFAANPSSRPLWDGKTFGGWHTIGKGGWEISEGAIHGTHAKTEKEFGHLVTDKVYKNFDARLKFKALKGNSGFYFRIEEKGASGVSGFQAEIDATKDIGGLYETNGRTWVVKPTPEEVQKYFKPGDWNSMTVSSHGGHIVVTVNGVKTAELNNDPGRAEGHIALQLHANLDCDVWFKDLNIIEE
jgi:hypothetical protein